MPGAVSVSRPKDPRRVEAGRAAMRRRWGPQRIVRLDELDADTARLIRALVANAEAQPAKRGES